MANRRVYRTPDALVDLDAIWDFIAGDSEQAADRMIDELAAHFELLLKFPEIGELQPSLADGTYRRSVVRNFVVYYQPDEHGIMLARIFHGAQEHERLI
jgi:plasmid stabilization system protein ParE